MKVLHVSPAFYPATYWGGPIYSVYGLCNALASITGITLRVLTTDSAGPRRTEAVTVSGFPMRYPAGYEVYFCKRWWAASVSPGMLLRLWPMIRWADVVHLTGTYSPPTIPTLLICRLLGKPVVWSPRGALQRWERSTKPQLKMAWEWLCNALMTRRSSIVHVTSEQEEVDSKARITRADFAMIPNGVVIPRALPDRTWKPEGKLRLLYMGRLHPIKGIENLMRALNEVGDVALSLEIYGDGDDAYKLHLHQLVHELGLQRRVSFHGHVNGEEKTNVFMRADVCVVPSYSENFGMVVVEALAHGVPVIASRGTPWTELEKHGCGLQVENSPTSLADAVIRMNKADISAMGSRGRNWMVKDYSWEEIGSRMMSIYRHIAGERL